MLFRGALLGSIAPWDHSHMFIYKSIPDFMVVFNMALTKMTVYAAAPVKSLTQKKNSRVIYH